jgi:hypothetical protein
MGKYDAMIRQDAATRLAPAEDEAGVEDYLAGGLDIVAMFTGLPPVATATLNAVEGAIEGDGGKTIGGLTEGAKAYAAHKEQGKKDAFAQKELDLKKQSILSDQNLAGALRAKLIDDEEEE